MENPKNITVPVPLEIKQVPGGGESHETLPPHPRRDVAEESHKPEKPMPGKTGVIVNYCLLATGLLLGTGAVIAGLGPVVAGLALTGPIGLKAIFSKEKVFNFSNERELNGKEKALVGTKGHEKDGIIRKIANGVSTPVDVVSSVAAGAGKFVPVTGLQFASAAAEGLIITPIKTLADLAEFKFRKAWNTLREGFGKTAYETAIAPLPVFGLSVINWTEGVRGKDKAVRVTEASSGWFAKRWRGFKRFLGFNAPEPAPVELTQEQHGQIYDAAFAAIDEQRQRRGKGKAAASPATVPRPTQISPQETLLAANGAVAKEKRRRVAEPKHKTPEKPASHLARAERKEETALSV